MHLFLQNFSLPLNFLLMCFDTALMVFCTTSQVSSLPHEVEFYWTRLRAHLEAQEPFADDLDQLAD